MAQLGQISEELSDIESTASQASSSRRQHEKLDKLTPAWFRSPVTDYVTLMDIRYPRATKSEASLKRLERMSLVSVFYQHFDPKGWFAKTMGDDSAVFEVFVDSDDRLPATTASRKISTFKIMDRSILELLQPVMESVNYALPNRTGKNFIYNAPFSELFFAQGRIIEVHNRANLPRKTRRLLRLLLSIMQLLLGEINSEILELSKKKTIKFPCLWSLFPLGSFATTILDDVPHIYQVAEATFMPVTEEDDESEEIRPALIGPKPGGTYWPYKFHSYGFDGYNVGVYNATWECSVYFGEWPIDALRYRPLTYERKYVNKDIVKDALIRGRKVLELQNYHLMNFQGQAHKAMTKYDSVIQLNGKVIVDAMIYNDVDKEAGTTFPCYDYKILPVAGRYRELSDEARALFDNFRTTRPTDANISKRIDFYTRHKEYTMLIKPMVPAYSLDLNGWYWLDVLKLTPNEWPKSSPAFTTHDPETDRRLGHLYHAIDQYVSSSQLNPNERHKAFTILVSGVNGVGKTSLAQSIADIHRKPLLKITPADLSDHAYPDKTDNFPLILTYAREWDAVLQLKQSGRYDALSGRSWSSNASLTEMSRLLQHYTGVVIISSEGPNDIRGPIKTMSGARLHLNRPKRAQREHLWRDMIQSEKDGTSAVEFDEFDMQNHYQDLSVWKINGHEIRHVIRNAWSLAKGGKGKVTFEDLQAAKDITVPEVIKRKTKNARRRRYISSSESSDVEDSEDEVDSDRRPNKDARSEASPKKDESGKHDKSDKDDQSSVTIVDENVL